MDLILIEGLAFFMLLMAMMISTSTAVNHMIPLYKWQSGALAGITLVTAFTFQPDKPKDPTSQFFIFLFTIIPVLLMVIIEPLLALASVPEDISDFERIKHLLSPQIRLKARQRAYPVWLAQRPTRSALRLILLDLFLMVLAFITAFTLVPGAGVISSTLMPDSEVLDSTMVSNPGVMASILAISFSLLLIGLSIMRSKQDIISQIMGLLIMEHGMFLAAIRLITAPTVMMAFVISLFLYIIITLTILVFLLPDLHRISGTIDIDQQDQLKG